MADSNRVSLAFIEETTYGTTPTSSNTFTDLRITGESLTQETETTVSAEIVADRQVSNVLRTGLRANGDINWELVWGNADPLWEASLMSADWTSDAVIEAATTDITVTDGDTLTTAGTWDITPAVGDIIRVAGYSTAANNGYFKVSSASTTTITVTETDAFTATASGDSVTITRPSYITNGTTFRSFSIEKLYTDADGAGTNEFAIYTGMAPNTASLNIEPNSIMTGSFGWLGKQEASGSSTAGDGSNTAAPTGQPFNAIDNVPRLIEGGESVTNATQFGFELNNNLRERLAISSLGAISLGTGKFDATGSFTIYFENNSLADKYLAFTGTSLTAVMTDADSDSYVVDFPQVKFTAGSRQAGGTDQDVFQEMSFTAYEHATEGITMKMVRMT